MALGAGPAADVRVGVDVLAATAEPRAALRALRVEIKKAEQELAELVRAGASISAKAAQLKALEAQFKHVETLDKRNRDIEKRNKQALALGKLANASMTAQAVGNIVRGGMDAQSAFTLAAMAMQHEKAIESAFGTRMLSFVRNLAPVMPLLGAGILSLTEGFREKKRLEDQMESIGAAFKNGRMTKAQELLAQDVLTETWFGDPAATVSAAEHAAKAVSAMDPSKMRAALASAIVTKPAADPGWAGSVAEFLAPGMMGNIVGTTEQAIDPDEFLAAADALYKQRLVGNRGALSKQQYESVFIETMADYVRTHQLDESFLNAWTKQVTEGGFERMQLELSHDAKLTADDDKRRYAAKERARFIPSRMEY